MTGFADFKIPKIPTWAKIVAGAGVALMLVSFIKDNDEKSETTLSGISNKYHRNKSGALEI